MKPGYCYTHPDLPIKSVTCCHLFLSLFSIKRPHPKWRDAICQFRQRQPKCSVCTLYHNSPARNYHKDKKHVSSKSTSLSLHHETKQPLLLATQPAMLAPASSRILARALSSRSFHASARRLNESAPLPARKPMGAFRGGLFGFLFGSVLAGGAVYSYVLQEYKASNELLTEDIYTLQASVTRLTNHVKILEEKIQQKRK